MSTPEKPSSADSNPEKSRVSSDSGPEKAAAAAQEPGVPDDLYILTDMHLGGGRQPGSIRFNRLENFFYDNHFERFITRVLDEQAGRGRRATLILGGDVFDFLIMTDTPTGEEAREYGIQVTRENRRFGMTSSPRHTEWKLQHIARGHPKFFRSLGRFLVAGHRIIVVGGNHDAELYWVRVREALVDIIIENAQKVQPDLDESAARSRIEYRQWIYREPGRIYFEHGNQYEETNSIRFNLCPVQPERTEGERRQLDLPIGSLFVRYLYNETRRRNPYLSNFVSMDQYMSALAKLNLADILGVLIRRLRFFSRALQSARLFERKQWKKIKDEHLRRLEDLANKERLPVSALQKIQEMKAMPEGLTKYHVAMSMIKPVAIKVLKYVLFAALGVFCWFAVFSLIQSTPWLAESFLGKASLTALLALLTVLSAFVYLNRISARIRHFPLYSVPDIVYKARNIAELAQVKHVVMGHSHVADLRPLDNTGGYFANTGTWVAITGTWERLWPRSRRFTFVRLQDDDLELLRWDDEAGRFEEVYLLEDYQLRPTDVIFPGEPVGTVHEEQKITERMDTMDTLHTLDNVLDKGIDDRIEKP